MTGNGEGELRHMCPFLNKWCISEACACWVVITQQKIVLGVVQNIEGGTCALPALCMIMSNRPWPAQPVQRPVKLPFNIG